jgi:hypothetical protein
MTGRVLPFDASSHASADALLPFYVNATLRGEELAFVEQHVRTCEKCQHEIDWLRRIFADLGADPALQESARTGIALGSLRGIQSNQRPRIQERFRATPLWARWLLAAQLAAIAILGTSLATDDRVASYRTLGAPNPSTQLRDAFAVMFDPSITESDMRQIMLRVGARVVDGPTRTGVFVLEVPEGHAVQALQVLRGEPAVRLAEPLGPRTGR